LVRQDAIFFFHIPKTGGSSVLNELYSAEGEEAVFGIEDVEAPDLAGRVSRLLARDKNLRLVHGHLSPARLSGLRNICRVVLLRDPLERLQSHFCYTFQRRLHFRDDFNFFSQPQYAGKRKFDLECLCQWVLERKFDNYQTRFLAGNFKDPVDEAMLARAEAVLRGMDVVGTCDALPTFLNRLSHVLHIRSLNLRHTNISDRTVLQLAPVEREEVADRFLKFDQALYDTALTLSEGQRALLPIQRERAAALPLSRKVVFPFRNRTALELLRRTRRRLFVGLRQAKARARGYV
jgi:hypothetical protein